MKKRFLAVICSLLIVTLAGCASIDEFVNPVTEEPEPTVSVEHKYAYNGPESTEDEPEEEEPVDEEEPAEEVVEEKELFSYVGTLSAPKDYENYKYGSAPLSSVYLGLKYMALNTNTYETTFAHLESASPEKFIELLDKDTIDGLNSMLNSGWEIGELDNLKTDENGNIVELDDDTRDFMIAMQLMMTQIIGSEEQLQAFYDGTFVPDGSIQQIDTADKTGFSLDDDEFEREHATEVTIDGHKCKVWTLLSSFGINPNNNNAAEGRITYVIYTLDGSDTPFEKCADIDPINDYTFFCSYKGDLNLSSMTHAKYDENHPDVIMVMCDYFIPDPTGDEVVFQNDFELYGPDKTLVEF